MKWLAFPNFVRTFMYNKKIKNMATLIKKAAVKVQDIRKFEIGEVVKWSKLFHDGRSYETWNYSGEIIRINPKTVTVKDSSGNIWRVEYKEIIA